MQSTGWSLLMLVLVIGSIPAALWALKRMQVLKTGSQKQIDLVHQVSIGTRERLAIVQVRGRDLLIGITPQNISLLAELSSNPKQPPETSQDPEGLSIGTRAFAEALANTRAGFKNDK